MLVAGEPPDDHPRDHPRDYPCDYPRDYPCDAARDVRISNGEVVHIRPIRPDDAAALIAFHASLSPESIYFRFFDFHAELSASEVRHFTRVDYKDRFALVVFAGDRMVAVGRYDRIARTDEAEVAFLVHDDYQDQGIGTLLADELARAARSHGIRVFCAEALSHNAAMLEMFRRIGFPIETRAEQGMVTVRFSIEPAPAYLEALARREAARLVGSAAGSKGSC